MKSLAAVLAAAVLYRLPYLLNPASLSSDGAVVGLQARHILRGEWSWFLWGTNYQSSFDPLMHALAFAVFGSGPLTMVCGTLAAALLMIALAFLTLRRHLGDPLAALCCAPLIIAPVALNQWVRLGFRQWALTAFVAAAFLFDRAGTSARPRALAFAGGLLLVFMLYLDLFMLQVFPALALLALLCARDDRRRLLATAAGAGLGAVLFSLVRIGLPGPSPIQIQFSRLAHNGALLAQCGPWIVGARALLPQGDDTVRAWVAPWPVRVLQITGALVLVAAVAAGGVLFFQRRIPAGARRLGLFGFVAAASSLGAFLLSTWPTDLASVRYLVPGAVAFPFALAPAAALVGARRFALAFAPSLAALLIAGWLGYGDLVSGPLPVRTARGAGQEERELRDELRSRGIHAAAADYWLAYRLSFLWDEDPVVANVEGWERMPAYRAQVDRAPQQAWIFHPSVPQTPPERYQSRLVRAGVAVRRVTIAGFTVLFFDNPRARH